MSILQWAISFLTTPILNSLVAAYRERLKALGQVDTLAVNLAVKDFETQIEARKVAAALGPVGTWVQAAFALPIAFYMGKILVYDKAFGLGSTDFINNAEIMPWITLVTAFYFGGAIVTNVTSSVLRVLTRFR